MFKLSPARLLALAAIAGSAAAASAQIDMQQRIQQSETAGTRTRSAPVPNTRGAGLGTVPADFEKLKLAPGFLLSLNVLDDPDFTGTFRVDEQGDIAVPVLGAIHVAGETASEARIQIRQKLLNDMILRDPQVDLAVVEYTAPEVTIVGEVAAPGKYPLLTPHNLVDVLALAGGTTPVAGNEVEISGDAAGTPPIKVHYSRATNPRDVDSVIVHPGDTIQVKRAGIVYVLGAVNRPGGFVMQEEGTLNLLQAVSLAYGTSATAGTGTIYLLRRNEDGSVLRIALPYKKIAHGKSADVPLQATDVVFVPTSGVKAFLTNTQGVMTAAATASVYVAMGY